MSSLYQVITEIINFPELYIGKPSLERLYAFICGYLFQNEAANDHSLDGFNEFVYEKYHIRTDHNWSQIIQFFSNTEQEAFDTFIQLFMDFHSQAGAQQNETSRDI